MIKFDDIPDDTLVMVEMWEDDIDSSVFSAPMNKERALEAIKLSSKKKPGTNFKLWIQGPLVKVNLNPTVSFGE